MINTSLVDNLFEKYTKYSGRLILKDSIEADKNENENSHIEYKKLLERLSKNDYFSFIGCGDIEQADLILNQQLAIYTEYNEYYINLNKITGLNFYFLRNIKHLGIVSSLNIEDIGITSNDEVSFKEIYENELDYFNTCQYRFDFIQESLFNKFVSILLSFSTILRLIKKHHDFYITDQNINEYYLNNFLVSRGFLYYNNISYDKKKIFTKHIVDFYNGKGSLKTIKEIVDILNEKEVNIFEYYLFYDNNSDDYYFLKVKPDESFIEVFNNLRSDREENFNFIVDSDPSWIATKNDLKKKNIKFLKSKYFSIDSFSDITDSTKELAFLINKLKKYKNLTNKIYKFDLDSFSKGVELYDFMVFITLLSMKINKFPMAVIRTIDINENLNRFLIPPITYEYQDNPNTLKELPEIITDSIQEINMETELNSNIEKIKKEDKIDPIYSPIDSVRRIKKELKENFYGRYRYISTNSNDEKAYTYLITKYPEMEKYLLEEDLSLSTNQFLRFIDTLERILILYGQSAFKFKDIYSNLYLPKVIEIVNYFKSLNSYLLEFNNTLSIERESRTDIIGDSYSLSGIIKISNIDPITGNNSGNNSYNPDQDYPNKKYIIDEEVDLGLLNKDKIEENKNFGTKETLLDDDITFIEEALLNFKYKEPLYDYQRRYVNYAQNSSFIDNYSDIFEAEQRIEKLLENENLMYLNGHLIDFYGNEGTYKDIREKYNLSYKDFKEEISRILKKYYNIFGYTLPGIINKSSKRLYKDKTENKPFLSKNNKFRETENKIKETDKLFINRQKRSSFTDMLCIYENNINGEFVKSEILNTRYRTTNRIEDPSISPQFNEYYTGERHYKELIKSLIDKKHQNKIENGIIGDINIPDLDYTLNNL